MTRCGIVSTGGPIEGMNNRPAPLGFALPPWAIGPLRARLAERRIRRSTKALGSAAGKASAATAVAGRVIGKAFAEGWWRP